MCLIERTETSSRGATCLTPFPKSTLVFIYIYICLYLFIHLFNYLFMYIHGIGWNSPAPSTLPWKCRDYTMRMNSKTSDRTPRQRWANGFRFPSVYTHGNHELLRFAAGCVGWHTSCLPRWSACWRTWGKCCCCILLEREISLLAFGCYLSPICGRLVSSNHSNRFTNWFLRWSKFTSW